MPLEPQYPFHHGSQENWRQWKYRFVKWKLIIIAKNLPFGQENPPPQILRPIVASHSRGLAFFSTPVLPSQPRSIYGSMDLWIYLTWRGRETWGMFLKTQDGMPLWLGDIAKLLSKQHLDLATRNLVEAVRDSRVT